MSLHRCECPRCLDERSRDDRRLIVALIAAIVTTVVLYVLFLAGAA